MTSNINNRPFLIFTAATFFFCATPVLLNLIGIDFSSPPPSQPPKSLAIDDLFYTLSGAFTHTILEWSAFCVAIMIAILGFVHYRVAKEPMIPILCIALFCAGSMDAFHTLAADRLIEAVADNNKLIPFTWAISRTFNALIIIFGVSIFLINPKLNSNSGITLILSTSLIFVLIAFYIIQFCATHENLPTTIFPNAFITRPWDVGPLILYTFICTPLILKLNKQHPSTFSLALLVSMIPEITVELHMAFSSKMLFDNDFNIAHFLKIFAYLIPGLGLLYDYVQTYTRLEQTGIALLEEKTKIKSIVDSAVDGVITINKAGLIQSFNPAAERIFGYKEKHILNKNINTLIPKQYHKQYEAILAQHKYNTDSCNAPHFHNNEIKGLTYSGDSFPLDLRFSKFTLHSEIFYTGFFRDISRRHRLQQELKSREKLFSTFVNASPIMMWMLGSDHTPLMFNTAWLKFNNHSLEQEINSQWSEKNIHPDDRKRITETHSTCLKLQRSFDHEYRLLRFDGIYRWIKEIGVPHFDNGTYKNFIGICLDITPEKEFTAQLQHHTEDLERSNSELEQFAYIASHDLQEPLRMVSSYTQLLERRYKDKLDAEANEFIGFAVDGANRMQILIQDLLSFSRVGKDKQKTTSINIQETILHVIQGLKLAIEEGQVEIIYPESLPTITADSSQINQLFQNLIFNAIKYHAKDRPCIIKISNKKTDNMWLFSIEDNGIGIDSEYFDRIFVIFKRLHGKDQYSGTGIGLAICKRIVEGHGGKLWVESTVGAGSTFYFTLPIMI